MKYVTPPKCEKCKLPMKAYYIEYGNWGRYQMQMDKLGGWHGKCERCGEELKGVKE